MHIFARNLSQIFALLLLLYLSLLITSCSSGLPSEDHLTLFLEEQLTKNEPFKIENLSYDWIKTGENRLSSKIKVTIVLTEPLYKTASLQEALAVLKLNSVETALLDHAVGQTSVLPEPLRSSLREQAPAIDFSSHSFIDVALKVKSTHLK